MQAIIDSLPEHILNYKDHQGRTIIDDRFYPFWYTNHTSDITELKENSLFIIRRPRCIMGDDGKTIEVEGNIQDAIDHKVKHVHIYDEYDRTCNSLEDDVYKLLDAGHIQTMMVSGKLKSNGKQYHVDFMANGEIGDNITSYYNFGRETAKTVVLKKPIGPIINNLISLGWGKIPGVYPDTITSKFIGNTNYTNA